MDVGEQVRTLVWCQGRNRTTDTAIFRLIFHEHNQQGRELELSNQSMAINGLPWIRLTMLGHHGPASEPV